MTRQHEPVRDEPVLYIEPGDADGIPVDVFVTITALVSKAWPGAMMTPGRSFGRGFGIALPGRAPKRVTKKAIAEATMEPDPDAELGVLGWDGRSLSTVLPEELRDRLATIAYIWITAFEGAVNYVEQHLTHPDHPDQRLTFTVQWVKGKTPHELRQEAEAKIAAALRLHVKEYPTASDETHGTNAGCSCGVSVWPCDTAKALGVTA
jgi:hypothetical protein